MHLTEYDIACFLEQKGDPAARLEKEQHLADCPACAAALVAAIRVLKEIQRIEAPELPEPIHRRAFRVNRDDKPGFLLFRLNAPLRYAFAALLVAGLGWWYSTSVQQEKPTRYRSPSTSSAIEVLFPLENAVVATVPVEFRWRPVEHALQYRLTLLDDEGVRLWQGESQEGIIRSPSTLVFEAGNTYLWSIEAALSNGLTLSSNISSFRFAP